MVDCICQKYFPPTVCITNSTDSKPQFQLVCIYNVIIHAWIIVKSIAAIVKTLVVFTKSMARSLVSQEQWTIYHNQITSKPKQFTMYYTAGNFQTESSTVSMDFTAGSKINSSILVIVYRNAMIV